MSAAITSFSQIVWAVSQAAILFFIANQGHYEAIGVFTLSLSIFTPISLLLSANLRTRLALDDTNDIAIRKAFLIRGASLVVSICATGACVAIISGQTGDYTLAAILLITRAIDQISDLSIGVYQLNSKYRLISRSFLLRAGSVIPFFILYLAASRSLEQALVAGLLSKVFLIAVFDIVSSLKLSEARDTPPPSHRTKKHSTQQISYMFPFLDSLNVNSLRYVLYYILTPDQYGIFGLAQSLYLPFQLLTTSVGYRWLRNARERHRKTDLTTVDLCKPIAAGVAIGLLAIMLFNIAPVMVLEMTFSKDYSEVRPLAMAVFISMLFWPTCALVTQTLIASDRLKSYTASPAIGLSCIALAMAIATFFGKTSLEVVALVYMSTFLIRTIWGMFQFPAMQKTNPAH